MSKINIDLSELEKELRGIVHKYLNGILGELDVKTWIQSRIDRAIEDTIDKIIEKKVYKFLEESEIELNRDHYYSKKITLNDYIIKIAHDYVVNKIHTILQDKIEIVFKK